MIIRRANRVFELKEITLLLLSIFIKGYTCMKYLINKTKEKK